MHFNKLNGMGTKEENQKLRIERENARKVRKISKVKIWNIWDKVKEDDFDEIEESEEELRTLRENFYYLEPIELFMQVVLKAQN